MADDSNNDITEEQPYEKWIIDIDKKVFFRHQPRTNDYSLADPRLVHDMIGDHSIEIHSANFVLGPYQRVQSV